MSIEPEPYRHPIFKYSELAAQRRGSVIEKTIDLENIIDTIISRYYCTDEQKREDLQDRIICGLPFSVKINILMGLFEKHNSLIFKAYPRIRKDLNKIRDRRNELAHSWLDATVTFVGNRAKFKPEVSQFKSKGKETIYDEKRINALLNLILKYTQALFNWNE